MALPVTHWKDLATSLSWGVPTVLCCVCAPIASRLHRLFLLSFVFGFVCAIPSVRLSLPSISFLVFGLGWCVWVVVLGVGMGVSCGGFVSLFSFFVLCFWQPKHQNQI